MLVTERQMAQNDVPIDIICNQCGQSLKTNCGYEGLTNARFVCGFDSILGDGNVYEFALCEDCLAWMFKNFKHDPLILNIETLVSSAYWDNHKNEYL